LSGCERSNGLGQPCFEAPIPCHTWPHALGFPIRLEQFGVYVKAIAPGRTNTDFDGRSLVITNHPAYDDFIKKIEAVYNQPKRIRNQSSALEVANVIYKAATDGKKKLRYIVGRDAKLIFRLRRWLGHRLFIKVVNWTFLK
jgi:short-subunit dehydrogenase